MHRMIALAAFIRSMESASSSMRVTMRCITAGSPDRIGSSSVPCGKPRQ